MVTALPPIKVLPCFKEFKYTLEWSLDARGKVLVM